MTIEEHVAAFESRRPALERFTNKLESLVRDLLAVNQLSFHVTEARTKEVQSFRDKASDPTKSYADPLSEITDLSGIRVIAYYQDDADAIGKMIESEFVIDSGNSVIHMPEGAEFGYTSRHYVVQLLHKRAMLAEWSGMGGLKAEIQVRTVLQHAWAAISHKLQYKREKDIPVPLRRKLFRLSALFELADDEFMSLRGASGDIARAIRSQLGAGNQKLLIDFVSLNELVMSSQVVAEFVDAAKRVGFTFDDPDPYDEDDEDSAAVSISGLVQLCSWAGIQTIEDLQSVLEATKPWMESYLSAQLLADGTSDEWYATSTFICQLLLIGARVETLSVERLYALGWNKDIADRVFEVAWVQRAARE